MQRDLTNTSSSSIGIKEGFFYNPTQQELLYLEEVRKQNVGVTMKTPTWQHGASPFFPISPEVP
jgi:hypothetical protein